MKPLEIAVCHKYYFWLLHRFRSGQSPIITAKWKQKWWIEKTHSSNKRKINTNISFTQKVWLVQCLVGIRHWQIVWKFLGFYFTYSLQQSFTSVGRTILRIKTIFSYVWGKALKCFNALVSWLIMSYILDKKDFNIENYKIVSEF